MNLDELRAVRRKERQKDSLQHLRDTFYSDVAAYIEDLKADRREAAERADDPFSSPEVSRLTDQIETAEEVVEAVYERRVGKVVKLSSFAAADMNADEEGLTAEERNLFDDLVGRIKRNRTTVLDILGGERSAGDTDDGDPTPDTGTGPGVDVDVNPDASDRTPAASPPESDPNPETTPTDESTDDGGDDVLASAMGTDAAAGESDGAAPDDIGGGSAIESAEAVAENDDPADDDRTTIRITRDVGRIFGVDEREYELADEDVVTLPTPNAEPLLERDAAERIE